jgi:ligand-binding sensor domain-containing protein/signal transduction histidine kinase
LTCICQSDYSGISKPRMRHLSSLILTCLCIAYSVHAQEPVLRFEHLSGNDGLANTSVQHIIQDARGFLWIGTLGGLHQFDGYQFKIYRHSERDSSSISNNDILFILEDDEQTIWAGTRDGLNQFDRNSGKFFTYRSGFGNATLLKDKSIRCLHDDKKGNIWMAVSELGLLRFNKAKKAIDKLVRYNPKDSLSISSDFIKTIRQDEAGNLWLGSDNGLSVYDPQKGTSVNYRHESGNANSLAHNFVKTVCFDRSANVWIGTDGGLSLATRKNDGTLQFKNYFASDDPSGLSYNAIKSVMEDRSGKIWIATDNGLEVFDPATKIFSHNRHDEFVPTTIANNYCHTIFQDKQDIVWIGTDAGISIYDEGRFAFSPFQFNPTDYIGAVYEDHANVLWLGTNKGLKSYHPEKGLIRIYDFNPKDSKSLTHNLITAIAEDRKGNLWIGTDRGLNKLNEKREVVKKYLKEDSETDSYLGILTVMTEKNGRVWAGTWNGLSVYDSTSDSFTPFYPGIVTGKVQALLRDHDGDLWIGTRTKLVRITQRNNGGELIKTYTRKNSKDTSSLSYNNVTALFADGDNKIWIGTGGGGLNSFYKQTEKFIHYTWDDGMPSDNISSIESDDDGFLWISTDKGLSHINTGTGAITNYDESDGLQSNTFNLNASFKRTNGEMLFGNLKGLSVLNPQKVKMNNFKSPVYITELQVFNNPVLPGSKILPKPIQELRQINLEYTDKVFTLNFVALNFRNPSRNTYAYKMENFDKDWNYTSSLRRFATYTNLAPGKYTFKVKSANNDGLWSDQETSLIIVISPPFWSTWWFYTFCIFLLAIIIYTIFHLRVRYLKKVQVLLQNEVGKRTRELHEEKESLEKANMLITDQRDEIEAQKELIERDRSHLEEAHLLIQEQNEKLQSSKTRLEDEVRKRTQELKQTLEKMVAANNELDFFVYRTAHDLKGPIARLEGLSYVGQLEKDSNEAYKYLKKIQEVSLEMNTMLSRLLRTRSINRQEVRLVDLNLSRTVKKVVSSLLQKENGKDVRFEINIPDDASINTDPELLDILLENIIQNAIRYRDRERSDNYVKICYSGRESNLISIEDNGIGIEEEIKQNVFEMFFIGTSLSNGFGLGLYEAQLIARKLKGRINLNQQNKRGTEIQIILP